MVVGMDTNKNSKMMIGAIALIIVIIAIVAVMSHALASPTNASTTQSANNQATGSNLTQFLNITTQSDYNYTSNQTILSSP